MCIIFNKNNDLERFSIVLCNSLNTCLLRRAKLYIFPEHRRTYFLYFLLRFAGWCAGKETAEKNMINAGG